MDVHRSNIRSGDHIENGEEDESEEGETGEDENGEDGNDSGSGGDLRGGSATVEDEGDASSTGDDALAIGGDGYDDLAVDVTGERNMATYDDSNVVQGGDGGANAQVGDSDTSGAVIMDATDSTIGSGNST